MQRGEWNRKAYVGVELRGKTLGVIGMGRIGSGVAKRALAFDMNVIAYDPYINEERAKALGVTVGSLDDIVEKSDFITVHMPLTKETRGMISMKEMRRMKKGVRLVNCARGGIINETDLAAAVREGLVAGAAIDVFEEEPMAADHPLRGVPGVVLTPHLGASTVEAQIGVSVDVAEGIRTALRGEPVTTAVNMAPVSKEVMRVIRPYITLAERLGCTVCSLAEGAVTRVEVIYNGEITEVNTSFLTTAILKGMLNPILESEINYVNAPSIAKSRGIKVTEVKEKEPSHYPISPRSSLCAPRRGIRSRRCREPSSARRGALSASTVSAWMSIRMRASSSARTSIAPVSSARSAPSWGRQASTFPPCRWVSPTVRGRTSWYSRWITTFPTRRLRVL